jgi:hypothetical protein
MRSFIELQIAAPDGTTFALCASRRQTVREVKQAIAASCGAPADSVGLFRTGEEAALQNARRLDDELGLVDKAVLFMLRGAQVHTPNWSWTDDGADENWPRQQGYPYTTEDTDFTLTGGGLVANYNVDTEWYTCFASATVTGGEPMTQGSHYWEVEYTECGSHAEFCGTSIGAIRLKSGDFADFYGAAVPYPHLGNQSSCARVPSSWKQNEDGRWFVPWDREQVHSDSKMPELLSPDTFAKQKRDRESGNSALPVTFEESTVSNLKQKRHRVGVLLNLDAGWMRFYVDGQPFTSLTGVTGPLVRAATMDFPDDLVVAVQDVQVPEEGTGLEDGELWTTAAIWGPQQDANYPPPPLAFCTPLQSGGFGGGKSVGPPSCL